MSQIIADTYEILEKIGSGGGGIVYLGRHLRLNKQIVLKADTRTLTAKPETLRREVDALKDLSHTYIPKVYDFLAKDGVVYTVMDYIEGESLDKPLERGTHFTQPQIVEWICELLEALVYLHNVPPHGLLHADIKPSNIMLTPKGDIRLIDFNIALALGESGAVQVGLSQGYASPEHYGIDYTGFNQTQLASTSPTTQMRDDPRTRMGSGNSNSSLSRKGLLLDVRSDIYSLGATFYHLLTGRKPSHEATSVAPIQPNEASPALIAVITKAMQPDPDLRYQSAAEMLHDMEHLHEMDPRTIKQKRQIKGIVIALALTFLLGGIMMFTGQQRVARTEAEKKEALAAVQMSEEANRSGDSPTAVERALEVLTAVPTYYEARAQKALTDALGVYELSSALHPHRTVELPSEVLKLAISPEGTRFAALYAFQAIIFDSETGEKLAEVSVRPTAASDLYFLDENTLLCSGIDGVCAYDIDHASILWQRDIATRLALSDDHSRVASVNGGESQAIVYDTSNGAVIKTVSFGEKKQRVPASEGIFADPNDVLLALNADGTRLAASFENGGLSIYDLEGNSETIFFDASEFTYFDGGFYKEFLAFSIANLRESYFIIFDTQTNEQNIALSSPTRFLTSPDERGIYVAAGSTAVQIDPVSAEEKELAHTSVDMRGFVKRNNGYTLVVMEGNAYALYDESAKLLAQGNCEAGCELLDMAGPYVVLSDIDSKTVQILKLETHSDAKIFSYDSALPHSEVRMSADGETFMLFRYDSFYLFAKNGQWLAEQTLPNPEAVYDQQYRRDAEGSRLEVIYKDGRIRAYSAADGSLLWEKQGEMPDENLTQTFETSRWRITAPLHGVPVVYDKKSGEVYMELEKGSYLTYVTEVYPYLVAQFISAQGEKYGLLLNQDCETLADLPGLNDVVNETLLFDDQLGNVRSSRIYSLQELMTLAEQ